MCGPGVSVSTSQHGTVIHDTPQPESKNGRAFRRNDDNLLYVLVGKTVFVAHFGKVRESGDYQNSQELMDALEAGDVTELSAQPTIIDAPHPDTAAARGDRLKAAQADTGFKLFDMVQGFNGGGYGKVIGFGRVNNSSDPNADPARVLLVHTGDNQPIGVVPPSAVDYVATAAIASNN